MTIEKTPVIAFPKNCFADGVYIGLDEDTYHSDPALGSTDIRNLLRGANVYWHRSWMNPLKLKQVEDDSTKATVFGTAMHKALLEGIPAFREIYVRRPDDAEGATSGEKGTATKAAKAKLKEGQVLLHSDEFDSIMQSLSIVNRDPDLEGSLEGGLSEVSIFWTRDGVRMKCRIDKLKLNAYCDLKTIANEKQKELGAACADAIFYRGYEIQIEHYNEGRRALVKLAEKSAIYFATVPASDVQQSQAKKYAIDLIHKIAAQASFSAAIMFIPKPTSGSPDPLTYVFDPADPETKTPRDNIETALMIYRDALKLHGTQERWRPNMPTVRQWNRSEAIYGRSRQAI